MRLMVVLVYSEGWRWMWADNTICTPLKARPEEALGAQVDKFHHMNVLFDPVIFCQEQNY